MVGRSARRWASVVAALTLMMMAWGCGGSSTSNGGGGSSNGGGGSSNGGGGSGNTATSRTVSGFVGDATSGLGIVGATVTIGAVQLQTGASGLFSLSSVARQDMTVTFSASGYVTQSVTLAASTDQLQVRLVPTGVSGSIQSPPGAPGI